MFKRRLYLIIPVLLFFVASKGQTTHFEVSPQNAVPGQTVKIYYNPEGTPLAGQTKIKALVYSYINYRWQVSDLPLLNQGAKYTASVTLGKDCGFAGFKFTAGDSTDSDQNRAYAIMFQDAEHPGVNAAGAYAGWAFLRSGDPIYGIPDYVSQTTVRDTAMYYWLNQEIVYHAKAGAGLALALPFAHVLRRCEGTEGDTRIGNILKYLLAAGTEDALLKARSISLDVQGNVQKADSLGTVLLKNFPNGEFSRLKAYQAYTRLGDQDSLLVSGEQFLKKYPLSDDPQFDAQNRVNLSNIYQTVVILHVLKGDYAVIDRYLKNMPYQALLNLYYKTIQIPHDRKDMPDSLLYPYALKLIDRLELYRDSNASESLNLSPEQWKSQFERYLASGVLPTHVDILRHTGHYREALVYAARAEAVLQYNNAALNDNYSWLLHNSGQTDVLNDILRKSMFVNQSSEFMIRLLKEQYMKVHQNERGFDTYLAGLKNPALKMKNSAGIRSELISDSLQSWSMSSQNGKKVTLKSLLGKTVVLDFWATWCVPCKASFPGMKLAVEHYQDDPNVVFYFVDTEEQRKDYKQQVARYIKDNHYPFNILFDNKNKGTLINDAVFRMICKQFGTSGIPLKLIIDPKGKVRFIQDGYEGSPTGLADEVIEMVEIARKN